MIERVTLRQKYEKWQQKMLWNTGWNVKEVWLRVYFILCGIKPIKKNKIIFRTNFGKGYMDHEKYIAEELLKTPEKYELVWLVNDINETMPKGIRKVNNKNRYEQMREMATAKIWFDNMLMGGYVRKRRGQIYINTKHWSSVTLKKFNFDSPIFIWNKAIEKRWEYNARIIDYFITGSDFDTDTVRHGFHYTGKVLQVGSPRVDVLFHPDDVIHKVYDYYNIPYTTKIFLYAPTFRAKRTAERLSQINVDQGLDTKRLHRTLHERFGGDWVIMYRAHPSVNAQALSQSEYVIQVSEYCDSEELLCVADIVCSDYSSIVFDPSFVGKPVFLYATDYEEYLMEERELYFDLHKLPFPFAENNDELMDNIENFDETNYKNSLTAFFGPLNVCENGDACKKVKLFIDEIIEKY